MVCGLRLTVTFYIYILRVSQTIPISVDRVSAEEFLTVSLVTGDRSGPVNGPHWLVFCLMVDLTKVLVIKNVNSFRDLQHKVKTKDRQRFVLHYVRINSSTNHYVYSNGDTCDLISLIELRNDVINYRFPQ